MEIHNGTVATDVEVNNSSFIGNGAQGIRTASNVIVDGLIIADSTFDGNSYGIYLQGTINRLTIRNSEFINSVRYGGYMTETGPLTNILIENSVFNNNVVGLMVWNVQDNADIKITGSTFDDNDKWGLLIWGKTLTNVLIEKSSVQNNDGLGVGYYGIDFFTYDQTMNDVKVHCTNISGHAAGGGIKNRNSPSGAAIVDATANWWCDDSGPTHDSNPSGVGDAVTGDVSFDPWRTSPASSQCVGAVDTIDVGIDIKPGSITNPINLKSNGKITVAILSTQGFNATVEVDKISLTFGKSGGESSLSKCTADEDVNEDGLLDVVCHFRTQDTGFIEGDILGILKGITESGTSIEGSDVITVAPGEDKGNGK